MPSPRSIDILLVTALREEYEAVLAVKDDASPGSKWSIEAGPLGHEVAFRSFLAKNGQPLQVVATWTTEMGQVATAQVAERLVAAYSPRCLAMSGVCAGRRDDVNVGDVIVGDRLWSYDTGKLKVEIAEDGTRSERVQGDIITYNLREDWKRSAESFDPPCKHRPPTAEEQAHWILERLDTGEDPRKHPERKEKAPDYSSVVELLWKKQLLEDGQMLLTAQGKAKITRLLNRYPDGLPTPPECKVRVGSIATGSKVVQDPQIFDRLSLSMRKVIGLEMEASAIGAIAHTHSDSVRYMLVMKAVMDHADEWKTDAAKKFAARASAECLIAFLRQHLPTVDHFTDILTPGTSARPDLKAPSTLLNARHEYVPFYEPGRAEILARLDTFCASDAHADVWLIHGEGGMGKTRLFIEATRRYREKGWIAGFLNKQATTERFEQICESALPALVVIDYAESRPELAKLLASVADVRNQGKRSAPLRLVLLARNAGDWWQGLLERDGPTKDLLMGRAPEALSSLVHASEERAGIVQAAASQFAKEMGKSIPPTPLPPLNDVLFERALYLHIAALAWVEGLPIRAERLMDDILEHEERFWGTQATALQDRLAEDLFIEKARSLVAATTLRGGVANPTDAKALCSRVNDFPDERVLAFLHHLYPAPSGFINSLEPDLLGEGMVWRTFGKLKGRGDSIPTFLDRIFPHPNDPALSAGFALLGRLSVAHAAEVSPWVKHLLKGKLADRAVLALEAAKTLGEKTAFARLGMDLGEVLKEEGTIEVAQALQRAGVPDWTVSLREVRAWVTETRLRLHDKDAESLEARAARAAELSNLGVRQSALGQREAALRSTQEAVEILRALDKARPYVFLPDLATSLHNLGVRQSELGQREAALASTQRAVEIRRTLAKARPEVFLPALARSLHNLGIWQSELGQREAALLSTQEAVEIRRALAKARPDVFLPDLAGSLNNLGAAQSELGQREAALRSTQEAVESYRALAKARPDVFLPDLANSLNNLGNRQSELGQREAALRSTQEAVESYRTLAKARPEVFLPDLAMSLNNLGAGQSALGQREAALLSTQEAVEIRRRLAKAWPDVFLPDLAMSLNNLGIWQSELGQREAALLSTQEAVEIRRTLAKARPDVFLPDLAGSLFNLAIDYQGLGRISEAVPLAEEALGLFEKLAERYPAVFGGNLENARGLVDELRKTS